VFLFVHCAVVVYVFRYRPLLLFSGAELWPALAPVLSLSLSRKTLELRQSLRNPNLCKCGISSSPFGTTATHLEEGAE
jgi:hypothetical protein